MGEFYRARDMKLDRTVASKAIPREGDEPCHFAGSDLARISDAMSSR